MAADIEFLPDIRYKNLKNKNSIRKTSFLFIYFKILSAF